MAKKASNEDKVTLSEAFINFQIQLKNKDIQDLQEEINQLETKKQKYKQLHEQLKKEQQGHIKVLWRQAKEQQRKLEQEVANKEQVEQAQQQNLDLSHSEEAYLTELQSELSSLEKQVLDLQTECHLWLKYKNIESQEHQAQITHLQEKLAHMQRDLRTAADGTKQSLETTFNEIDKRSAQLTDEKRQLAIERATKDLDKPSKQEIKEKEWLQKEIASYREEVSTMALSVRSLEEENLQHISWLYEQRTQDLNIPSNVFLTEVGELEPSHSIQERSLKNLTSEKTLQDGTRPHSTEMHDSRFAGTEVMHVTQRLEVDETDSSCSSAPQDIGVLLDSSQSQLRTELHLDSLEQRLLCVVGQAVLLPSLPPEDDGETCLVPKDWALTTRIINNKFK